MTLARYVLENGIKDTIDKNEKFVVDSVFMVALLAVIYTKLFDLIQTTKNPIKRWWAKKLLVEAEIIQKEYMAISNN